MKIGIDARMFGPKVGGGGLGRYVEQLITELQSIDHKNRFVLFLKSENFDECKITSSNFKKRLANIDWYSLKEQTSLSKIIDKEKLDIIHFPHWNVPINLKTPFLVTIHDLILLEEPLSSKATTRNPLIYLLKYIAYKFVLKNAINKSRKIIAISEYTKSSIKKWFPSVNLNKISVIYQGVTNLPEKSKAPLQKDTISGPYILYVGNAYPHKNLGRLVSAFKQFNQIHPETKLVLAGKNTIFYKRLLSNKTKNVIFVDCPTDNELKWLYENATFYAFPSLVEGFGLPPLEAMKLNLPVIASNNTALPEILENAACYFDPKNENEIFLAMKEVYENKNLQNKLISLGQKQIEKFSWNTMAKTTKNTYESCD